MADLVTAEDGWLQIGSTSTAWRRRATECRDIRIVAIGTAASRMARAVLGRLDSPSLQGCVRSLIVTPNNGASGYGSPATQRIVGGHPEPTRASLEAAEATLSFLEGCTEHTLVVTLLSGGGSSLVERLLDHRIPVDDIAALHRVLRNSDLDLAGIDTVRKHLSAVKGGRLAATAAPAEQVTLYVSDAPEGHPSMVASGPTMPDETTVADCRGILREHGLMKELPASVQHLLNTELPEAPKPGDAVFERSRWIPVLSNRDGVAAMREAAEAAGIRTVVDVPESDLPVAVAAERLLARLRSLDAGDGPVGVVSGGEVVCPVRGPGIGGRNLEFVLRVAEAIADCPIAVLSFDTDGKDGNSPGAGAVVDGTTAARARLRWMDLQRHLHRSNAWPLLDALGDTLVTGPTGQSVRDLRLAVAWPD